MNVVTEPRCEERVSGRAARAHAEKNCLSIILAVAGLVTPTLAGAERQRMDRLRDAAKRLALLLDDDIDDATQALVDRRADVDVERLFFTVCRLLHDRAEAAAVKLVVHCAGGRVRGNECDLAEALFNLIANAVEATPPRHGVLVSARMTPDGDQLWSIQDSGGGMSPRVLEQVGIPRRTFRPGGSGLGVAVARSIVEDHGGWTRFDSRRGRGTTVTVWLPRA